MSSIKDVLSFVPAYIGLQKGLGADRLRYAAIDAAAIRPGEVVVDVGCGPAYYFDRLRQPITYHGYDTDERYVRWSTKKYGDRGTFHHAVFDEKQAEALPVLDVVLLLGLLHHLSDKQAHALLALCAKHLTPGGRVVSIDPCFVSGQGRVEVDLGERQGRTRPKEGRVRGPRRRLLRLGREPCHHRRPPRPRGHARLEDEQSSVGVSPASHPARQRRRPPDASPHRRRPPSPHARAAHGRRGPVEGAPASRPPSDRDRVVRRQALPRPTRQRHAACLRAGCPPRRGGRSELRGRGAPSSMIRRR
ncbi:methyltransferase [Mumia sp. zg.B21]|nr:methyltransferase [Mumia sp. zg.B21]